MSVFFLVQSRWQVHKSSSNMAVGTVDSTFTNHNTLQVLFLHNNYYYNYYNIINDNPAIIIA